MDDENSPKQQGPWTTAPDITKRLPNPFRLPGGPAAVAGLAASCRHRVSEFQDDAVSTLAELDACVEQGLQQQSGAQVQCSLPLAAAFDVSDLRLPCGVIAVPPYVSAQQAPALQQQQQQQQQQGLLACSGLLEACKEAARGGLDLPRPIATTTPGPSVTNTAAAGSAAGHSSSEAELLVPGQEVIVTLQLLEACTVHKAAQQVMQELQVLGSNTLADLRDAIRCPLDKLAEGLGATNPAAYLYLGRVFYDDTRMAASAECSELVQKWAAAAGMITPKGLLQSDDTTAVHGHQQLEQRDGPIAHLDTPDTQQQQQLQQGSHAMQHTRVRDLQLQVSNRPMGLFSHQGCCEHQVMVVDVRLLHSADPQQRSSYPRTTRQMSLAKRYTCGLCRRQGGLTLLLGHPEAPEEVVMLCSRCEELFDVSRYPRSKKVVLADEQAVR